MVPTSEIIYFMNQIKKYRKERGLTQVELAKAIGASQPAVANWEAGRRLPRGVYLKVLNEFFGISLSLDLSES